MSSEFEQLLWTLTLDLRSRLQELSSDSTPSLETLRSDRDANVSKLVEIERILNHSAPNDPFVTQCRAILEEKSVLFS